MRRLVDHVQDDEDVPTLLDDLQEAVSRYQVCLSTGIFQMLMKTTDGATDND